MYQVHALLGLGPVLHRNPVSVVNSSQPNLPLLETLQQVLCMCLQAMELWLTLTHQHSHLLRRLQKRVGL